MSNERSTNLPLEIESVLEDVFFRPAHWHSAYEVAVQRLAQAIKLGALKHGARLPPERELVERLGVSRTTLREGIRALQQEGFLFTRRGRTGGTFITDEKSKPPTKRVAEQIVKKLGSDLPDLLDLRLAVEPKCAELAAERAPESAVENLQLLAKRGEGAPRTRLRQADSTLHIVIAHSAQSDRLLDLVLEEQMRLHGLLEYLAITNGPTPTGPPSPVRHRDIVEAIASRDPKASFEAMRQHIEASNLELEKLFDQSNP